MESTSQVSIRHVIKITMAAALGGFLFGFDSSVINGANGALKVHFSMTDSQLGRFRLSGRQSALILPDDWQTLLAA